MMMMDEFCDDGYDDDTGCHSRGKAHGDKAEDKSVEVTKQDGEMNEEITTVPRNWTPESVSSP